MFSRLYIEVNKMGLTINERKINYIHINRSHLWTDIIVEKNITMSVYRYISEFKYLD